MIDEQVEELTYLRSEIRAVASVLRLSGYEPREGESIAATVVRALGDFREAGLSTQAAKIEAEMALAHHLAVAARVHR